MAERVHPADSPRPSTSSASDVAPPAGKPISPAAEKPPPAPGTYVIQIPKDQVFRVPSPENARRFERYSRRNHRRSRCCCCLCWLLALLAVLVVLLGIAVGVFFLIVRPQSPNYSIDAVAIRGLNLTSVSAVASISPEFDLTVRADNPNKKIGIYYEQDSSVQVFFSDVKLSDGALPAFFQPPKNITIFRSLLRGSAINLSNTAKQELIDSENRRSVPLKVEIRAPIKVKIGSIRTWKIKVKVSCNVMVDELTAAAKIVSKDCDYSVKPW